MVSDSVCKKLGYGGSWSTQDIRATNKVDITAVIIAERGFIIWKVISFPVFPSPSLSNHHIIKSANHR
jgi:hypothetical protein